jgi:hypothetical protein
MLPCVQSSQREVGTTNTEALSSVAPAWADHNQLAVVLHSQLAVVLRSPLAVVRRSRDILRQGDSGRIQAQRGTRTGVHSLNAKPQSADFAGRLAQVEVAVRSFAAAAAVRSHCTHLAAEVAVGTQYFAAGDCFVLGKLGRSDTHPLAELPPVVGIDRPWMHP